jgi:hypothetical protein
MKTFTLSVASGLAALLLIACGNSSPAVGNAGSNRWEYKLASIEKGGLVAENDPLVGSFGAALNSLEPKCKDSRERIADMAVTTQKLLKEKGISLSLLRILQDVNRSIPSGFGAQPCADVFAAYVTLQ